MHRKGPLFRRRHGLCWRYGAAGDQGGEDAAEGPEVFDVGRRLRALREERSLTIRALAEKSGLAVNTLSLIENGKSSPSVGTLQQVAWALEVPIAAFFESEPDGRGLAYVRAGRRPRAAFEHGVLEDLGAGAAIQAVEPFVVTLEPGAGSGGDLIVHTGYEFVFCLEGRLGYTVAERTYLLEPGDSLLFEGCRPHCWQNLGDTTARMILVLYPTDERDTPTERHFIAD